MLCSANKISTFSPDLVTLQFGRIAAFISICLPRLFCLKESKILTSSQHYFACFTERWYDIFKQINNFNRKSESLKMDKILHSVLWRTCVMGLEHRTAYPVLNPISLSYGLLSHSKQLMWGALGLVRFSTNLKTVMAECKYKFGKLISYHHLAGWRHWGLVTSMGLFHSRWLL